MNDVAALDLFPVQRVQIQGQVQAYREAGQGQAVVLLHGISSGSGSWVKQLQHLGHRLHLLAWDAPGYGQSDALLNDQPTAQDYAQRIKAWLDAIGIETALVVGHSLGAIQASAFAHFYPERVQALVLANLAQGYAAADAETQLQVYTQRPKMLQQLGCDGMAEQRGPHLVYQKTPAALALIKAVMRNLTQTGFSQASYLLAYDAIQHYLKELTVPCHVIAGREDGITPAAGIEMLAQQFDLPNFYSLADAGHLSYLDQPDQFEQILLKIILNNPLSINLKPA